MADEHQVIADFSKGVDNVGQTGRLVILSGPSCAGKGPLCSALETFYPQIMENMHKLVLYNSRQPRPGDMLPFE